MTTKEMAQLNTLKKCMEQTYCMIASNPYFQEKYAKRKLREIINYINGFDTSSKTSYQEAVSAIEHQYRTMFPPRGGLSEFHFWHENFATRQELNQAYEAVKAEIESIFHNL